MLSSNISYNNDDTRIIVSACVSLTTSTKLTPYFSNAFAIFALSEPDTDHLIMVVCRSSAVWASSALGAIARCRLIEQIRRLVITSPTEPLTTMKAGVFDTSKPLRSLEVRPTTLFHVNA